MLSILNKDIFIHKNILCDFVALCEQFFQDKLF
jgi:hypothetical protein